MSDLGKAYVQILPKADGISEKIKSTVTPGAGAAGTSAGNSLAGNIKKAIAGAAIGATVVKGFQAALDEGAKLQQSYGGLDTLYGDASAAAKDYAMQAAQAGISANDYAEQAVSFGASLKAAFGGDTAAAADAANTAILDMADNAAKMGTPLESIQNAYQGFAKGNYTMLDNLKLGYGGTKSEMERLLADATKLTGVEYDMDNLGDVYSAIHAIQGDLGLTGVAAEEASSTFSGSFGAMKASAQNVLAMLSTGGDVGPAMQQLANAASTFLFDNLVPMVGNVIGQLPTVIGAFIQTGAPLIMEQGTALLTNLINGVMEGLPLFAQTAADAIRSFADNFGPGSEGAANLIAKAFELITSLGTTLFEAAGIVVPAVIDAIWAFFTQTDWMALGSSVVNGIQNAFNELFPLAVDFVGTVVSDIADKLGFPGVVEDVRSTFEDVKNRIKEPIEEARDLVDRAVSKIKGMFPIKLGKIFDGIKLPHFEISGGEAPWGVGNLGTPPSVGIEWYARGGIINQPKLIGVGEAGPEAVIPLSGNRLQPLADAIAEADARNNEALINGMYNAFSAALGNANLTVQISNREFGRIMREAGV